MKNIIININGKTYNSWDDWRDEEKKNPNSTNLIWEYQRLMKCTIIDGKIVYPDGRNGVGKCWWKGKCYEGEIEYRDNKLYVGGEYVKDV